VCFKSGVCDSSARAPGGGGQGSLNESLNPENTTRDTLIYVRSTIQYGRNTVKPTLAVSAIF